MAITSLSHACLIEKIMQPFPIALLPRGAKVGTWAKVAKGLLPIVTSAALGSEGRQK